MKFKHLILFFGLIALVLGVMTAYVVNAYEITGSDNEPVGGDNIKTVENSIFMNYEAFNGNSDDCDLDVLKEQGYNTIIFNQEDIYKQSDVFTKFNELAKSKGFKTKIKIHTFSFNNDGSIDVQKSKDHALDIISRYNDSVDGYIFDYCRYVTQGSHVDDKIVTNFIKGMKEANPDLDFGVCVMPYTNTENVRDLYGQSYTDLKEVGVTLYPMFFFDNYGVSLEELLNSYPLSTKDGVIPVIQSYEGDDNVNSHKSDEELGEVISTLQSNGFNGGVAVFRYGV